MASPAPTPAEKQCCIVKRIKFFGRSVKIVMQNENGPCPLLAIANVLSLRNELKLPAGAREITQSELITSIVDLLLERSKHFEAAYAADYQQNISEIFPVLQKLTTGVDVNVKFHNLHAFEPTPEVAVFDLLGIPLVHGWLVDPQDATTTAVFSNKSYNELVEMLFLVLGDEEMEALSTGPLRNLSISSHHMQQHSFSSAAGSPLAAARTPSANATAPDSRSTSFRSGAAAAAAAAAAAQNAELHKALHALSISEGSQQQQQPQSQQRESVGGAAAHPPLPPSMQQQQQQPAPAGATASSIPQQQQQRQQQQHNRDTISDPDIVIEALMEDIMQEVCSTSMPGSIELGDSPTHNVLLTRRLAYEGAAAAAGTPSRLGGIAAAAGSGQPPAQQQAVPAAAAVAAAGPVEQQQQQDTTAAAAAVVEEHQPPKASAADAAVVRRFMEAHCSQLTHYGLSCMAEGLKEHQLAVFFRNNQFNALFKYEGAVYLLVTDQGYEYEPDIVWERLDSVQGDTTFCTSDFTPFVPHRAALAEGDAAAAAAAGGGASYSNAVAGGSMAAAASAGGAAAGDADLAALTDLDAAIAASLAAEEEGQQQQQYQAQRHGAQGALLSGAGSLGHEDADFALALQLQLQEEEAMARAQAQQQQQQQGGGAPGQGRGQQQQQQRQGSRSRLAAVQQQEQQAAAQPLESLQQMGHRFAAGVQEQYAAATSALLDQQQQPAAHQQQQQQGRRRSSNAAGGRRASSAQDEKCSIM